MESLDIWGRPEKATPHKFEWALAILRAGGRVRRRNWGEGCFIRVNEHNILVFFLNGDLSPIRRVREVAHHCDWRDMASTDWEKVDWRSSPEIYGINTL